MTTTVQTVFGGDRSPSASDAENSLVFESLVSLLMLRVDPTDNHLTF